MKKGIFINDSLKISITNVCNYDCSYCSNEGQEHTEKEFFDIDYVKKLCNSIKNEEIYVRRVIIITHKLNNSIFIELVQEDFWNNGVIPNRGMEKEELIELLKKRNKEMEINYNKEKGLYYIKLSEDLKVSYALDY